MASLLLDSFDDFFIDEDTLKSEMNIAESVSVKKFIPVIREAQNIWLQPLLSTKLFSKLLETKRNDELNEDQTKLIRMYLIPALMSKIKSNLGFEITFEYSQAGVVKKQGSNFESLDMEQLERLAARHTSTAEEYATRMIEYIKANKNKFPDYQGANAEAEGGDVKGKRTGYRSQIFVG